jgi:hypothetical protein
MYYQEGKHNAVLMSQTRQEVQKQKKIWPNFKSLFFYIFLQLKFVMY